MPRRSRRPGRRGVGRYESERGRSVRKPDARTTWRRSCFRVAGPMPGGDCPPRLVGTRPPTNGAALVGLPLMSSRAPPGSSPSSRQTQHYPGVPHASDDSAPQHTVPGAPPHLVIPSKARDLATPAPGPPVKISHCVRNDNQVGMSRNRTGLDNRSPGGAGVMTFDTWSTRRGSGGYNPVLSVGWGMSGIFPWSVPVFPVFLSPFFTESDRPRQPLPGGAGVMTFDTWSTRRGSGGYNPVLSVGWGMSGIFPWSVPVFLAGAPPHLVIPSKARDLATPAPGPPSRFLTAFEMTTRLACPGIGPASTTAPRGALGYVWDVSVVWPCFPSPHLVIPSKARDLPTPAPGPPSRFLTAFEMTTRLACPAIGPASTTAPQWTRPQ